MSYPQVLPGDTVFTGLEHARLMYCVARDEALTPPRVTLVTWEGDGPSEIWQEDQAAPYVLQGHAGTPPINTTPVPGYEWLVTPMLVRVKHDTRLWLAEDNGFWLDLNTSHAYDVETSDWLATLRDVATGHYWTAVLGSVPHPNKGMLEPFLVAYPV
jgi:hypothetical protein